jgi:SAM-dependent methyltransferase
VGEESVVDGMLPQAESAEERLLLQLRYQELRAVRGSLPASGRLLELGTGNGFQARVLQSWGYDVVSVDVKDPAYRCKFFTATYYDGVHLPFADQSFDVVFSSNCLEHVRVVQETLAESVRVLKPGGISLHLIPSVSWRLFTSLGHFVALPRLIRRRIVGSGRSGAVDNRPRAFQQSIGSLLFKLIGLPAHGEFATAIHELWYYRRGHWIPLFTASGLEVCRVGSSPLFYTGNVLLPALLMETRQALARFLGAACSVYYLRRPA